ncbi:MAG: class I SAM-dependent methyltransferase [Methylococcales bacterium]|nr:class I SAM-dependent methyltransferase [Methylococcales bacterium]
MSEAPHPDQTMFEGVIGQEYAMLSKICPQAPIMSQCAADAAKAYRDRQNRPINIYELGGGTGITTLALLLACPDSTIESVEIAATMQNQARESLKNWLNEGRLQLVLNDALSALQTLPDASFDVIASAYTLHNFEHAYRDQVMAEIFRVLKPGGLFVNGDRYGLDDINAHTESIQLEVRRYFEVLTEMNRLDLLEQWIVHLFSDESENHVMRTHISLDLLKFLGFTDIQLSHRQQVNALVTALKP